MLPQGKVKTGNCMKIPHQYRGSRSSGGVLQNSENEGIKTFLINYFCDN